jgi:hypothetical protein
MGGGCAHDHGNIDGRGQILEKCAQRGDADPAADQRDALGCAGVIGKGPVRSLDSDAGTRLEMGDRVALVTRCLHRKPEVRRPWQCGERVGMGLPPQVASEKAPLEELATRDRQAIKPSSGADDRVDPGGFGADAHDAESVAKGAPERKKDAVGKDEARSRGPHHDPDRSGQRMTDE